MEGIAARPPAKRARPSVLRALAVPGPAGWLFVLLLGAIAYAVFADGATTARDAAPVGMAIGAGVALGAVALAAGALDGAWSRAAWAGAGLLTAFAAFSAISIAWSAAPDEGWLGANRAVAYAGAVAISLVVAPRIRSAPIAMGTGIVAIALAAAAYALTGRIAPELVLGPVSFESASELARLREPLGYSNALGLLMMMAAPVCVWLSGSRSVRPALRGGAVVVLCVLIVTAALAISRGAIAAGLAAAMVMVAVGPHRLGRLIALIGAAAFALPPVLFAFSSEALSEDGIAASERAGDGELLGLCLAGSLLALAGASRIALRLERRGGLGPASSRRIWRAIAIAGVLTALAGVGALATSDRGLTGTITGEWREFRSPDDVGQGPERLLSAGGSNRWSWWREAVGAWSDDPVSGWGVGSFPVVHLLYRDVPGQVRSAHSVPLQWLAEGGLIGAGLAIGGLAALLAAAIARIRRSAGAEHGARVALVAAFAAWAIHSLADWSWEIPALTLPALAALAFAAAAPVRPPRPSDLDPPRPWRPRPLPLAAGGTLLGVLAIASSSLPALSADRLAEAERLAAAGQTRSALEEAELARELNPLAIEPAVLASTLYIQLGDPAQGERVLIEAARSHPDDADVWSRVWNTELLVGNPEVARAAFERSVRNDPLPALVGNRPVEVTAWLTVTPPDELPTAAGTPPREGAAGD